MEIDLLLDVLILLSISMISKVLLSRINLHRIECSFILTYSQHHIQDGSVPRMIECNRYALSVCVLLSNGNMCMFESTNYRKYAITNYMLNNNGKLNGVRLIRSYPISAGRCLTIFSDEDGDSMTISVIHGIKENEFRIIRILPRNVFDVRCSISSACYDMTGHLIILGCEDGSLHVFNTAYK